MGRRALAAAVILGALVVVWPVSARVGDGPINTLYPESPALPTAKVGTQYGVQFQVKYNGDPYEYGMFGCKVQIGDRPDLASYFFDDCAKLPPGLTFQQVSGCTNSGNGCLFLGGTPTKAGTYAFRVAASDGQGSFVIREYRVEVREETTYDLYVYEYDETKQRGLNTYTFQIVNSGPAASPATSAKVVVKAVGKVEVEASASLPHGIGLKDCGKDLVCPVRAMPKGEAAIVKIQSKLVGREGTYVRLRLEVACDSKEERSCANNYGPGRALWQRVTVPGR